MNIVKMIQMDEIYRQSFLKTVYRKTVVIELKYVSLCN